MAEATPDIQEKIQVREDLKEPSLFRVIYLNDEKTTMQFVVESLIEHFDYNPATAERITMDIHENGAATVAVLPYELAEQKGIEVTVCARSEGFPLQVKLEPDEV